MRELLKRKKSSMPWSTLAGKAIKNVWGQGLCRISQIALMGSIHITGVVGRYRIKGGQKKISKSYTKDRRAYEYWSDGNIHAANQFMGSRFFKGASADHIGPISLGFVHDPRYLLQPMPGGDNSSKRDRLQIVDIESIVETEKEQACTRCHGIRNKSGNI